MAKLSKSIRKGAGGAVRSQLLQGVLRDLIKAAIIAAATKFAGSRTAEKAKGKAKRAIAAEPKKRKVPRRRKRR